MNTAAAKAARLARFRLHSRIPTLIVLPHPSRALSLKRRFDLPVASSAIFCVLFGYYCSVVAKNKLLGREGCLWRWLLKVEATCANCLWAFYGEEVGWLYAAHSRKVVSKQKFTGSQKQLTMYSLEWYFQGYGATLFCAATALAFAAVLVENGLLTQLTCPPHLSPNQFACSPRRQPTFIYPPINEGRPIGDRERLGSSGRKHLSRIGNRHNKEHDFQQN